MKKEYLNFICSLDGYLIRLKELHWSATNNAQHILCDEIGDTIDSIEDRFAEYLMGETGKRIKIGNLKPMLPNSTSLLPLLSELSKETSEFLKHNLLSVSDGGGVDILNQLLEEINKYKYRATLS